MLKYLREMIVKIIFQIFWIVSAILIINVQTLCDGYSEMEYCHETNFRNCKVVGVNTGCWQRSPAEFDNSLYSIRVHGTWDRCYVAENPDGSGQRQCVDNDGWWNVGKWPSMKGMMCCNGCPTKC